MIKYSIKFNFSGYHSRRVIVYIIICFIITLIV